MSEVVNLIRYWRASLVDTELTYPINDLQIANKRLEPPPRNKTNSPKLIIEQWLQDSCKPELWPLLLRGIEVSFEEIQVGHLKSEETIVELAAQYIAWLNPTEKDLQNKRPNAMEACLYKRWLQTITEENLINISTKNLHEERGENPKRTQMGGKLIEHGGASKDNPEEKLATELNVLIGLFKFNQISNNQSFSNSQSTRSIIPLWIPAKITRNGEMFPNTDKSPFIPRIFLEPQTDEKEPVVGSLEDADRYISRFYSDKIYYDWNSLFQYSVAYLEAAKKEYSGLFYQEEQMSIIIIDTSEGAPARHIIKHLDYYIHNQESIPELLRNFCSEEVSGIRPVNDQELFYRGVDHLGQMNNRFPLFPSQREALHYALGIKDGEILAVNGPPGTGKTTLIHSIIASTWVQAAYKRTIPPVMVVTSSNNQAVTNAIDSFARVFETHDLLQQRWIPQLKSFGLYLVSQNRLTGVDGEKIKNQYHYSTLQNAGFSSDFDTITAVNDGTTFFLKCFNEYFNQSECNIEDAEDYIHKQLTKVILNIQNPISKRKELNNTYKTLLKKLKSRQGESLDEAIKRAKTINKEQIDNTTKEINEFNNEIQQLSTNLAEIKHIRNEFLNECRLLEAKKPILFSLFKKRKDSARYKKFFIDYNFGRYLPGIQDWTKTLFTKEKSLEIIEGQLYRLEESIRIIENNRTDCVKSKDDLNKDWIAIEKNVNRFNTESRYLEATPDTNWQHQEWINSLDKKERFQAFILAMHYWEARWLRETKQLLESTDSKLNSQNQESKERRFRRNAMLTPGIVTTLFMFPAFFSYFKDQEYPLRKYIDYLFIDEAGQVIPAVASTSLGCAKKAVVFGDILQIEPVWSIPQKVDSGNLVRYRVITNHDAFSTFEKRGLTSSTGCVMVAAQNVCGLMIDDNLEKGVFLAQHTRCEEQIIQICNDLVYQGRLKPRKISERQSDWLPELGYYHVDGKSKSIGTSRVNEKEIEVLVDWLQHMEDMIIRTHGRGKKKISEVVGIVTPFNAQARRIKAALPEPLQDITVGTVHSLQGAEREVILFSTVYTMKDGAAKMLNQKPNLINVAVSRAKESFIVFGDTSILKIDQANYAAILGRHILINGKNLAEYSIETSAKQINIL